MSAITHCSVVQMMHTNLDTYHTSLHEAKLSYMLKASSLSWTSSKLKAEGDTIKMIQK